MKFRKIFQFSLIGLACLTILSVLGLSIWSAAGTYPAREVAREALNSTNQVHVTRDRWFVFTPQEDTDIGLIFYPGGLVEPAAYAPVLSQIAEEGYLVVITPMPLNLAIFNSGAAADVIEAYPEIDSWLLAGHSLGGAAAGIYAANNPEKIEGVALWDSFPPDSADLSGTDLSVMSIYGTTDGIPNTDNFNTKRPLLPDSTQFIAIEGASHAQFGDYGPQKGDVEPTLRLSEQHRRVTELMLDFLEEK